MAMGLLALTYQIMGKKKHLFNQLSIVNYQLSQLTPVSPNWREFVPKGCLWHNSCHKRQNLKLLISNLAKLLYESRKSLFQCPKRIIQPRPGLG
jgi:hypothetical protein